MEKPAAFITRVIYTHDSHRSFLYTSVYIYQTTRHHIPEDSNRHSHCCENARSYKNWLIFETPSLPGYYAM